MQYSVRKILLSVCILSVAKQQTWTRAQDVVTSGESQVPIAIANSLEVETTTANESVEELATTTEAIEKNCSGASVPQQESGCQCDCTAAGQLNSDADKLESTPSNDIETTTISDDNSAEGIETTTVLSHDIDEGSSDAETVTETSDSSETTIACNATGDFPHPSDCRRYFSCSSTTDTAAYEAKLNYCPTGQAFNNEFSTCMRDLSPCSTEAGGFECLQAGSFADPQNATTHYYRCVPHLNGQAGLFHIYHINCGAGKIFMPELGKCFLDLNSSQMPYNPQDTATMPDDEQLVKAELKQWKLKEKAKLKQEKLKIKYEKKLQKELEKKAKKEAKAKAKAEEKLRKEEEKTINYDNDD